MNCYKILALIPARGGSKGIKNKNIIPLYGRPLIDYTIRAALDAGVFEDIIVSTDSMTIAETAISCGAEVPFMRPSELATDDAKTISAVLHALANLKKMGRNYDIMVLLQPTQPLRTASDIQKAVQIFVQMNLSSLVSITPVDDHPLFIRTMDSQTLRLNRLIPDSSTIRRQDLPVYYRVNGAIYINWIRDITAQTSFNDNIYGFMMDKSHAVDIDDLADLDIAEYYLKKQAVKDSQ